eukprot:TCALIF_08273-PA protein Name:"Similar to WDR65 WD repeat-containing protein 65 (Homo sapiens)" AED:0.08 eAED:0.08 QI:0/0.28/0.12/0.75/0.42/0.37/8/0/1160
MRVALFQSRSLSLAPLADCDRHLTALCVNKNRKLLAFAERGDRPYVIVYDLEMRKRRKVLRCAEFSSEEVISLAFSHDSKYLLAQGGAPDFSLVYFFWEKNKVITTLKNLSTPKVPIHEVSFHPKNHNVICIIGSGFFRMCRLTEGVLKQFGFQKGEHHQMLCHDWMNSKHVLIGTKSGKVLLLEDAELRATIDVHALVQEVLAESSNQLLMSVPVRDHSSGSTLSACGSSSSSFVSEDRFVHAIVAFKSGFLCSLGLGKVAVFELLKPLKTLRADDEISFKVRHLIRLPKSTSPTSFKGNMKNLGTKVISIALNNNESHLIALTETLQIVSFNFKEGSLSSNFQASKSGGVLSSQSKPKGINEFRILSYPFHNGAINGMDNYVRSIWNSPSALNVNGSRCVLILSVVTCGVDKTIRIWNYLTLEMELSREFEETVESVALHPTGLQILAGFADRLRLMNLLIDDIDPYMEFNIKSASVCKFSRGGHLLSATSDRDIVVYSTIHFGQMALLKGHSDQITAMCWSFDDRTLVSCANDGSIYEWDISNHGQRVQESVIKTCSYNDVTLDAAEEEKLVTYAVGSDKTIKEICQSGLLREIDLHTLTLSSVALSFDRRMLFSGSTDGRVQAFKFPLTLPGTWEECDLHGDAVTQIRLSHDNRRLITAGRDGSLCIWSISKMDLGEVVQYDYAHEILITKIDLEEKNKLIFNLQDQVEETKTESEYQLRLKDNQYEEEINSNKKKANGQLAEMRATIHKLQNDLDRGKRDHDSVKAKMKSSNEKALIELADQYKSKLIVEYQKFETLEEEHTAMKNSYERKLKEALKAKEEALVKQGEEHLTKIQVKDAEIAKKESEAELKVKAVEEMLRQTEEDADKEIMEMKRKYEKQLRFEKDANVRLRGESGVLKKKYHNSIGEVEDQRANIQKATHDNQKLQQSIRNMEKDMTDLKKEVRLRDETITERERRIADQRKYAMELEKNRELNTVSKIHTDLELQVEDAKARAMAYSGELVAEKKKVVKQSITIERMNKDLGLLGSNIQDGKQLKEVVAKIYRKYNRTSGSEETSPGGFIASQMSRNKEENEDNSLAAIGEILRQKEFLERNIISLKEQIKRIELNHEQAYARKVKENTFLVEEIDRLKEDLRRVKSFRTPKKRVSSQTSSNT